MRYRRIKIIRRTLLLLSASMVVFLIITQVRQVLKVEKEARVPPAGRRIEVVKDFFFSQGDSLKEWDEKVFRGKVLYRIEKDDGLSYVRAISTNAASALYYKVKLDARKRRPVVSWRWRVEKFPIKKSGEDLAKEAEDDFAARVYVIFPAVFLTNSKVLEYVWAEHLPPGTTGTSPYSKNIKLMVLRKGIDKDKKWFTEERDVYDDYVRMFGKPPEYDIGAVAFMTNTEHTQTTADAMYDDIAIGYSGEIAKGGGGT